MITTVITPARIPVSKIGLGCVTFGREIDEATALQMLDHAHARGITFFDTASAYGQGASELMLGHWMASRRIPATSITIATKILPPYDAAHINTAVDDCRQRLGVDILDLLYLHRWDAAVEKADTLTALDALVHERKVRALGVSNFAQHQLQNALALQQKHKLERFSVVQNNHNLAVRDADAAFRNFCAEHDVAIVTYSPLGAGFLTGKHQRGVQAGSRFEIVPGHQNVYFHDESWQRLARLETVAARSGHSQAHLALAWALHEPGIASVLVGGRTPAHIDQALAAETFNDPALFAELEDAELKTVRPR
jgi:aryl-alcohol dehydrogenase-like predicted oxidoreductase